MGVIVEGGRGLSKGGRGLSKGGRGLSKGGQGSVLSVIWIESPNL